MAVVEKEQVIDVHHWNDSLFSFKTTRDPGFRFKNGHFTMLGLEVDGKPLLRAYSIASANYEEELEFFSIKVPDGPLTSRLQNIQPGDDILISRKPTGTLVTDHLIPGKNLYLLATGTGLAPFMSIIKDPEAYELYDKIILVHGVRHVSELAYQQEIEQTLPNNEF
ncbi:MAG: ferredoxin--NADP reductase, partial [Natronospirillum sp.]